MPDEFMIIYLFVLVCSRKALLEIGCGCLKMWPGARA